MEEFKSAARAGKLILSAVREIVTGGIDNRVSSRFLARSRQVLVKDLVNPRGQRTVADGAITLYTGFDFNKHASLEGTCAMTFTPSIDRVTGDLEVTIPAYAPSARITAPAGTTHYRFLVIGAEYDFQALTKLGVGTPSGYLTYNETMTVPLTLTASMPPNSTKPLFLMLAIEFYQEVNGVYYALETGTANAFAILQVDA